MRKALVSRRSWLSDLLKTHQLSARNSPSWLISDSEMTIKVSWVNSILFGRLQFRNCMVVLRIIQYRLLFEAKKADLKMISKKPSLQICLFPKRNQNKNNRDLLNDSNSESFGTNKPIDRLKSFRLDFALYQIAILDGLSWVESLGVSLPFQTLP